MKNLLILSILLITSVISAQSQTYKPAQVKEFSTQDLMYAPMMMRQRYDANQKNLYQIKNHILELKPKIKKKIFIEMLDKVYRNLTSIENADLAQLKYSTYLQQQVVTINEIISDYNISVSNDKQHKITKPDNRSKEGLLENAEKSFEQKDYINAIQYSTKVLQLDKGNRKARVIRAISKYGVGDNYGSINDCDFIIENFRYLNSTLSMGYRQKAQCYQKMGDMDKALATIDKAVEASDQEAATWVVKSAFEFETDKYEEAIASSTRGIAIDSGIPDLYTTRAAAYFKLDKKELGCLDLSKAGELGEKEAYEYMKTSCN